MRIPEPRTGHPSANGVGAAGGARGHSLDVPSNHSVEIYYVYFSVKASDESECMYLVWRGVEGRSSLSLSATRHTTHERQTKVRSKRSK